MRVVSIIALAAVAGCGRAPVSRVTPVQVVSDRLYFGRNIPTGGTVSDSAWAVFLAEVVTPRFPDGFSVMRGEGQWRGANGVIEREAGFVFEVHHPAGSPPDSTFEAIAMEYCRRFHQEAVLRAQSPAREWMYRP